MDSPTDFLHELPETEWSVLENIGREEFGTPSWEEHYSLPVHDYLRTIGQTHEETLATSHAFFAQLFTQDEPDETLSGSFRLYLLQALQRFLPERSTLPITQKAEQAFSRAWLLSFMKKALDALQEEMRHAGDEHLFTTLSPILDGRKPSTPHTALATQLDLTIENLTTIILKMRQRYRHFLEQELRQSITTPTELDQEVQYLQSLWAH